MLVTTIIPVYNRAAMLRRAVESVLAQTHRPIELVIVDDGSTDDTPAAIAALAREHDAIRTVRRENGGPGAARESGRAIASGNFIQYLDSDDRLLPRKFELQLAAMKPEHGVAYGRTRYIDARGNQIAPTWKPPMLARETMFPSFLLHRWWDTPTPLYRRAVTDAAGPWTSLRVEEDWEYDARVAALGVRLAFVDEVVAEVHEHDQGRLSGAVTPDALRNRARAHELILGHARRGGMADDAPEMRTFARELFHLARQCGAAGLTAESKRLLTLAASVETRWDVKAYGALASLFGARAAGKMAKALERLR
ncbi:MAG TPA: glycosyltransferase family A protein [Thermoanaerobaculia bacterium]|nr:glycosyltransferase family A protein [Thermoanaerobaculia bacterium]